MLRNVKIHRMVPFFFFLLPILHSRISHDGKPTNEHVRSAQTHKCITRKKVRVKWWLVHPWLAGWLAGLLAPEALVGKLQRSLPRFISRLRASISMLRSIFSSPPPPPFFTRRRFTRSLARSLYFERVSFLF